MQRSIYSRNQDATRKTPGHGWWKSETCIRQFVEMAATGKMTDAIFAKLQHEEAVKKTLAARLATWISCCA